MRSATSSCRQSSRSAEQRWPAERNAEVITSSVTCSGKAVASTIMALMPPVSAISGTIGPSFAASARLMVCADFGRAGEDDAGSVGIGDENSTGRAVAGNKMQRGRRNAGLVQQLNRAGGNQRRLLGRLGDNGVAGGKRRCHLAEKDRERKIPRADADKRAAAAIAQHVALAGRSRHLLRRRAALRACAA